MAPFGCVVQTLAVVSVQTLVVELAQTLAVASVQTLVVELVQTLVVDAQTLAVESAQRAQGTLSSWKPPGYRRNRNR